MRVAFLVYVSRSGSTFLAHQLARASEQILVLPEFGLVDILLAEGDERIRHASPEELLQLFTLDRQLPSLELDREALTRVAAVAGDGGIAAVVERLAREYAVRRGRNPELVVIKRGNLIHHAPVIRALFPDSVFLHIVRDGRATASSRLRSVSPYRPGWTMGRGDPVHVATSWLRFVRKVRHLKELSRIPVMEVRYEDVVRDRSAVLRRLGAELGIDVAVDSQRRTFSVADAERSIHQLADLAPVPERVDSWKVELPRWQGVVIEAIQQRELRAWGYPPFFSDSWGRRQWSMIVALFVHVWRSGLYSAARSVYYFRHFRLLANRLRFYLLRKRTGSVGVGGRAAGCDR